MPSRFKTSDDPVDFSDGDESDTVCEKCHKRNPDGCGDGHIFWIDCDVSSNWYHVYCIYGLADL